MVIPSLVWVTSPLPFTPLAGAPIVMAIPPIVLASLPLLYAIPVFVLIFPLLPSDPLQYAGYGLAAQTSSYQQPIKDRGAGR